MGFTLPVSSAEAELQLQQVYFKLSTAYKACARN